MAEQKAIYELPKETAKKIRKELKKAFPAAKFSVTSEMYTGGSSVTARWNGGQEPDHDAARDIVEKFKSVKFDGMTDYADQVGYEYEGEWFNGADYVWYARS